MWNVFTTYADIIKGVNAVLMALNMLDGNRLSGCSLYFISRSQVSGPHASLKIVHCDAELSVAYIILLPFEFFVSDLPFFQNITSRNFSIKYCTKVIKPIAPASTAFKRHCNTIHDIVKVPPYLLSLSTKWSSAGNGRLQQTRNRKVPPDCSN